jgi:hypothetical protein
MIPILSGSCGVVQTVDTWSRMTARLIAATALAVGALAAPAAAAEMAPLKPCYVSAGAEETEREAVVVDAAGFAPNTTVEVLVDGAVVLRDVPTDAVGDALATVAAPYQERGEREFSVTVREPLNPASAVSATSRVTALSVELRPREARPSRRVRFRGRGFTAERAVYAHYSYNGRHRRTVRLGRPRGDCGRFSTRRRQIPVRRPRTGDWTLQIDQRRRYSETPATNWVRLVIRVREVFLEP